MNIGPQAKSDNAMTRKYRLLQSTYRSEVLTEDFGNGPTKNSVTRYGNMLTDGEETGSNFISEADFRFAQMKVEQKQVNKALTINEFRLYNNMLSSMSMCFNLFSKAWKLFFRTLEILIPIRVHSCEFVVHFSKHWKRGEDTASTFPSIG